MANNAILGAMLLLIKTKADVTGLNKTDKALRKTGGAIKSMSRDIGLIGKLSKGFLGYLGVRANSNFQSFTSSLFFLRIFTFINSVNILINLSAIIEFLSS